MKYTSFLLVLGSIAMLAACSEIAPTVTGAMGNTGPGPDLTNQRRQVLIEEFTGVRCVNCPAGSAAIEDLLAVYGPQLVAVSIHAGEFAPPYSDSKYDFRTPEGDQLLSYLGEPFGYPTAVINRRLFDGEFDLQLGQSQWAGYIQQELQDSPKVKINIAKSFQPVSRQLNVDITLLAVEDISAPDLRLSIMLTESGIHDMQLTPAGKQADYEHKHVLRDMLTPYDGSPVTTPLSAGQQRTFSFSMTLPQEWNENKCEIVAFVSLASDRKDVLQAHKTPVVN